MNKFIEKNINVIIAAFLLLQPILDLLTGVCLHFLKINLTIGIIIRILFLILICLVTVFIFKKKRLIIPYLIIGFYFIFYLLGIVFYKEGSLFPNIQGLVKTFYFPLMLVSLYSIKDEIRISKATLFSVLLLYLLLLIIPNFLNIGYQTYEVAKTGSLGFFNSANEISGIISLLTPIMFIILVTTKNNLLRVITAIIYLIVILMIGTKTPILALGITVMISFVYLWVQSFKEKKYKNIIASALTICFGIIALLVIIPKTNFYKNIEIHLDYLELDNIAEVFTDEKLVDHFIFSQRLTFLHNKAFIYQKSSIYQKMFGIGYLKNNQTTKLIEMDYFDIFYSHGVIGFLLFFSISFSILYQVLIVNHKVSYEIIMYHTSILLILFLAFFTGHILTAPSVSFLAIILILSLTERKKRNLIFADKNLAIGGIETAQVNLLNSLNYNKYNVTLVLEEKEGVLLNKLNRNIIVKELKVSNYKIVPIRKLINLSRQLIFTIFNYQNYDFSCCYTTYSYSCNKIAKIASKNNSFYVHSDYSKVYENEIDFRKFFDSRKVSDYKHIIFVSNESRLAFLKYYENLKSKTLVINNLIDLNSINSKSQETIAEEKPKDRKLFVFVGRLDDSSKKLKRAIELVKNIQEIELWIVGDGPDKEMYIDYHKKLNLEGRIMFLGKKTNPYPYIKLADYIILTSDYEGFPVTYLEALALNKNIITTIPTSDDSIDMRDYAYIISKDVNKMTEEVKKVLKTTPKKKVIDLELVQKNRIKELEKIINN